ncbi:MAG: pitrilysin family protein [Candidatus Saccharimonadales bacterium]
MEHTVKEITLKNGAKGLLIKSPKSPVTNIYTAFNAGFLFGDTAKFELPHVVEHMMFTNKKYPDRNQFSAEFEKNGAYVNAHTDDDKIAYDYECAAFETDRILELATLQLTQPIFPADELTTEVGNVEEELSEALSDHSRLCGEALAAMCGQPSLSERIAQLGSITRDDLLKFYKKTHTLKNAHFIVGGNIDEAAIESKLNSMLSSLPKGKCLKVEGSLYRHLPEPIVVSRDIQQIYYYFMSVVPRQFTFRELTAARLIDRILTDGFSSRIFGKIREEGLAYGIHSRVESGIQESTYYIGGFVSKKNQNRLFQIVTEEINNALGGNLTQKELDKAKLKAKGSFARNYQTIYDIVKWYRSYTLFNEIESFSSYPQLIDKITLKEATKAFTEVINQNCWGLSFVGNINKTGAEKVHSQLQNIWQ